MNHQNQSIYKIKKNRNKEHNLFFIYYIIVYIYVYYKLCTQTKNI